MKGWNEERRVWVIKKGHLRTFGNEVKLVYSFFSLPGENMKSESVRERRKKKRKSEK